MIGYNDGIGIGRMYSPRHVNFLLTIYKAASAQCYVCASPCTAEPARAVACATQCYSTHHVFAKTTFTKRLLRAFERLRRLGGRRRVHVGNDAHLRGEKGCKALAGIPVSNLSKKAVRPLLAPWQAT